MSLISSSPSLLIGFLIPTPFGLLLRMLANWLFLISPGAFADWVLCYTSGNSSKAKFSAGTKSVIFRMRSLLQFCKAFS